MSRYERSKIFTQELSKNEFSFERSLHLFLEYLNINSRLGSWGEFYSLKDESKEVCQWLNENININIIDKSIWVGVTHFFLERNEVPFYLDLKLIDFVQLEKKDYDPVSTDVDGYLEAFGYEKYYENDFSNNKCYKSKILTDIFKIINNNSYPNFTGNAFKYFYSEIIIKKCMNKILENYSKKNKIFTMVGEVTLPYYELDTINFFWS